MNIIIIIAYFFPSKNKFNDFVPQKRQKFRVLWAKNPQVATGEAHLSQLAVAASFAELEKTGSKATVRRGFSRWKRNKLNMSTWDFYGFWIIFDFICFFGYMFEYSFWSYLFFGKYCCFLMIFWICLVPATWFRWSKYVWQAPVWSQDLVHFAQINVPWVQHEILANMRFWHLGQHWEQQKLGAIPIPKVLFRNYSGKVMDLFGVFEPFRNHGQSRMVQLRWFLTIFIRHVSGLHTLHP